MQVGSPIFGEAGKTWNNTVCDNLDNGNYNEVQDYVQKVGKNTNQNSVQDYRNITLHVRNID